LNQYILINGNNWDRKFIIDAEHYVIDNALKHYLFYISGENSYILALNFYSWSIIGRNGETFLNPMDNFVTD
jgi:hypothetical protein